MAIFERTVRVQYVCLSEENEPDVWDRIAGAIEEMDPVAWLGDEDGPANVVDADADL